MQQTTDMVIKMFTISPSKKGGVGVFATTYVPAGTLVYTVGEVVARSQEEVDRRKSNEYTWECTPACFCCGNTTKAIAIARKHTHYGNFINEANSASELNVVPILHPNCFGYVNIGECVISSVFVVLEDLYKGVELLTWYGKDYPRKKYRVPNHSTLLCKLVFLATEHVGRTCTIPFLLSKE